ncbi:MAG: hypothetical protein R3B13_04175 [Polyangiaceae bacterium]
MHFHPVPDAPEDARFVRGETESAEWGGVDLFVELGASDQVSQAQHEFIGQVLQALDEHLAKANDLLTKQLGASGQQPSLTFREPPYWDVLFGECSAEGCREAGVLVEFEGAMPRAVVTLDDAESL